VGALALRVLRGEAADAIPVSAVHLNTDEIDWRQLKRWGLSEARIPAGTIVNFREPSVWDRYKLYIIAALSILVAQSILIGGLLVQRARRRVAERQVRLGQDALGASFERIRDLGGRLLHAQDSERARIARELHDDVSQQMALLEIDLELLGRTLDDPSATADALGRARSVARSVHDLSHRLHPAKLRLIGLTAALKGLQRELSQAGVPIAFTSEDVPATLPPDVTLCLFRVAQEALQNAVKHSGARNIAMHVRGSPEHVALAIVDDGAGFDVKRAWGDGLGLLSMKERVEAAGGRFELHTAPETGTRISVTVPLRAESA
jgi:signal transduction histidine kinase